MRRYLIFAIAIPMAFLFVRLGFWQLDRLGQRRALNAALEENRALPVLDLTSNPPEALPRFRRVTARGVFDFPRQVIVDAREFGGTPAVVVVTPLRLPGGHAVLVERGWALSFDAYKVDLEKVAEEDSAAVSGLVVLEPGPPDQPPMTVGEWPRHVQWLNPTLLRSLYPDYDLPGYALRRDPPGDASPGLPPGLYPVPVPELNSGPHLVYAIQWFAFALIALGGAVAIFRSKPRTLT
ncbi:MAG: SURF1 family protein [Gemmatimonadetes bacterium]|nr:SURF1 family protein [Gemmatimonadota bacterium]